MRKPHYLYLLALLPTGLLAQGNYVANKSNSNSPGTYNTLVGPGAGAAGPITSDRNTITGYNAGLVLTSGSWNTFNGVDAGRFTTTGFANTFIGKESGLYNTNGSSNTFVGALSGYSNTSGVVNTFVGYQSGYANTSGAYNNFFGYGAGHGTTTGNANIYIGHMAGYLSTVGRYNVFMGYQSGYNNNTGYENTFIGFETGKGNTVGNDNVFLGHQAGYNNTMGDANVFTGVAAGYGNTSGKFNVSNGHYAGFVNKTGSQNTAVGYQAGYTNQSSSNTFVGYQAGSNSVTGSNNTFVGQNANVPAETNLSNVTVLGYNAKATASNSVILGNDANVGIGNTAPGNKLEITPIGINQSGLRFTNLTSNSPASVLKQTKFLTVNDKGDVVLGSLNSTARESAESALWQVSGNHLQNANEGGVIIGSGVGKTPAGYRLYVAEGILTEKVKVAVKSTDDWSDKVFEKGYKLKSLAEVEQHIHQTGHLPSVPSAAEVVEKGIDLGKMDAKLLEKIEELTLYLIEQRKELEAVREQNKQLKERMTVLEGRRKR
ncbi:hypothetical protein [Larkinella terrae]|uniref:TMF family protein n=1 Tax=Larkinella terrae TaxID=2025311 RepID=A0A7K0EQJ6_9BACT|nr:hypothetical protein [Larkinella terrae]MRS64080.1 hypothetical protein [Larkinella terrae]